MVEMIEKASDDILKVDVEAGDEIKASETLGQAHHKLSRLQV